MSHALIAVRNKWAKSACATLSLARPASTPHAARIAGEDMRH
eukprot:gene3044-5097_t